MATCPFLLLTVVLNALGEFLLQAFVHGLDSSWRRLPEPTLFVSHGFLASFLQEEVLGQYSASALNGACSGRDIELPRDYDDALYLET